MQVMVLTGGIACGKSTTGDLLREEISEMEFFDCDAAVRRLLTADSGIAEAVRAAFGEASMAENGRPNRDFLRNAVFSDPAARSRLEAILHPRVMEECLDSRDRAAKEGADLFIAEIPLFFEKGLDIAQQQVLVVATSRATQVQRLKARGGFDDALIDSMIAAQMPVSDKMSRADVVFWNEGPPETLRLQVRRFCNQISK